MLAVFLYKAFSSSSKEKPFKVRENQRTALIPLGYNVRIICRVISVHAGFVICDKTRELFCSSDYTAPGYGLLKVRIDG